MVIKGDGKLQWGDGSNPLDVNLYRSAANVLYTSDNFSALNIIDRTPYYSDGNQALIEFSKIKDDGTGKIDHDTLPAFVKVKVGVNETTGEVEYGRSLSGTVSMLIVQIWN